MTVIVSYKHPRKRRLSYLRLIAKTVDAALKLAPKEIEGGKLLYGIYPQ